MPQYDSIHTGEQVDEAVDIVLANKSKGDVRTPVYLNADGYAVAVTKDTTATQNSENPITSGGAYTNLSVKYPVVDIASTVGTSTTLTAQQGAFKSYIDGVMAPKQDVLIAGEGISIKDNVVGVDTKYNEIATKGDLDNKWEYFPKQKEGHGQDLVERIKEAKKSTFELSKFTVVGSPTITDDGIASGFSSSNYLNTGYTTPSTCKSYKEIIEFTTGSDVTTPQVIRGSSSNTSANESYSTNNIFVENGNIMFRITTTGNSWDINSSIGGITANTKYAVEINWNGTTYNLYLYKNGVKNTIDTLNISSFLIQNTLYLGNSAWFSLARPFTSGSIDLKQFSITVDGVEVFSGNKTGIDTIKSDDYTPNTDGTYTAIISDDGILGYNPNFELTGYNRINVSLPTLTATDNWKIETLINTGDLTTLAWVIQPVPSTNYGLRVRVSDNNAYFICDIASSSSVWFVVNDGAAISGGIKPYTDYFISVEKNSRVFTLRIYNASGVRVGSGSWTAGSDFSGFGGNESSYKFGIPSPNGTANINAMKFYINGNLVWQGCLKIPYTLTSQGNKVVDAEYQSRVEDQQQQFGYTPYDVLEENVTEDFTKVGSVSIVDGIASGFSNATNYITKSITLTNSDNFIIQGQFSTANPLTSGTIFSFDNTWNNVLAVNNTNDARQIYSNIGGVITGFNPYLEASTTYLYEIEHNNGTIYFRIKKDTDANWNVKTGTATTFSYSSLNFGQLSVGYPVNLNAFKIYVDNELVYQPYKTPYYELATINESNLVYTYVNGITQSRKYADNTLRQQGSATSGTAVVFPTPFNDTNYFLSIPYSAKSKTGFTPSATGDWIAEGN